LTASRWRGDERPVADHPDFNKTLPAEFAGAAARVRIAAVAESFARVTGRALVPMVGDAGDDPVSALWHARCVILAHGVEPDPVFFFANHAGLRAFETTVTDVLRMPSRLSAEPGLREERARLLERVSAQGFIDDYAGIRISARGRRFAIAQATVWNVHGADGTRIGQAATFAMPEHALDG